MALSAKKLAALEKKAWEIRRKTIETTYWAGGGHAGGALSQTDILVVLFHHFMKIDPKNPEWEDRDRFILSKGHGGVGYAPILTDLGYCDEKLLEEFNHTHSPFGMHLDRNKVPGVDASTGSLGHGLPIAVGMALSARLQKKDWRTYCVIGDGECNEGSIWEAAMAASHFKLDNLTGFVDRNKLCIDGCVEDIMAIEPLNDKWKSFGWEVIELDGHNFKELAAGIDKAIATKGKPTMIIADTVKGKGVDYMENQPGWHYGGLDPENRDLALKSIDNYYNK